MKYRISVEYNEDHTQNKEHVVEVDDGLRGAALMQAIERQLDIAHGDRKAPARKQERIPHPSGEGFLKGHHPVEQHNPEIRDWRQWHLLGAL